MPQFEVRRAPYRTADYPDKTVYSRFRKVEAESPNQAAVAYYRNPENEFDIYIGAEVFVEVRPKGGLTQRMQIIVMPYTQQDSPAESSPIFRCLACNTVTESGVDHGDSQFTCLDCWEGSPYGN